MFLAPGTPLGPYELIALLGAGGMGDVYRARDARLQRDVALKVLAANVSSYPTLWHRLERKAKALSKLNHPHVCILHDIGHQDGVDFPVMELLDGETLQYRLTKGALQPEQTIRFVAQLADALATSHKSGIVHRDLRPSNIMITKTGVKLMDFGLAKECAPVLFAVAPTQLTTQQSKLTANGTIIGTFQYMAPEQLEGGEVDARVSCSAISQR